LRWWCTFFPKYDDVSFIKTDPWITKPLLRSTEARQTGAGAFFHGYFFPTPFPDSLVATFDLLATSMPSTTFLKQSLLLAFVVNSSSLDFPACILSLEKKLKISHFARIEGR